MDNTVLTVKTTPTTVARVLGTTQDNSLGVLANVAVQHDVLLTFMNSMITFATKLEELVSNFRIATAKLSRSYQPEN